MKERNYNRRYPKEYNIFRTLFYYSFLYVVVIPFMKIFYNYKITGRENLPTKAKSGKFIYTANHVSHFDPPMVTMACNRPIAYMAKKELFVFCSQELKSGWYSGGGCSLWIIATGNMDYLHRQITLEEWRNNVQRLIIKSGSSSFN